ncbi:drug/metabolite transporter (DMT)-like permease [Streptacidiphilus sp. MAP12-16]|uniref:hypothetical protein n=1 Tax=Streptacidiphilus sp. MAP12-16 TaxID=3156300 RepID=UPI0035119B8D
MLLGLAAAVLATIGYGCASVFQARGARRMPKEDRPGLRLLGRVARSPQFLLGTGLDIAAFALIVVALHRLPLFVVQAVTSASLAVTALAAVWLLGSRLARRDVLAIATVVAGLTMLAVSSGPEGHQAVGTGFHFGLLAATGALLLLTLPLAHRRGKVVAAALGLIAGTVFGVVNLSVRVLAPSSPADLFADPATYALMAGGLGGYLCYALALQRGSVTVATAGVVVGETFVPGLIGVVVLGDRARPGFTWLAAAGFAIAVGGAFVLSRFGEIESEQRDREVSATEGVTGGGRTRGRSPFVRRWQRTDVSGGAGHPGQGPPARSCEVEPMTEHASPDPKPRGSAPWSTD